MIERGQRLCLAGEALQPLRIGGKLIGQHFEGDITIQARIAGAIHLAHTAGPEQAGDFVGTDSRTGGKLHL